jgi:hypothetical protein
LKNIITISLSCQEIVAFAGQLNESRCKEASKIIVFDGWRQCLEILVLTPSIVKFAGVDFVTSILRVLLIKIVDTNSPSEYFSRLGAETVLTLCAVMATFKNEVNSTTLNVILAFICKWISDEQSPRVRATLYASILHVVKMFSDANEAGKASVNSFALILDHLCKDCCQAPEIGKMHAMYLMGEIICLTTSRGLGGDDTRLARDLFTTKSFVSQNQTGAQLQQSSTNRSLTTSTTFNKTASDPPPAPLMGADGDSWINASSANEPSSSASYSKIQPPSGSSMNGTAFTNKVPRRPTDYLPAHSNIMTYMFAKGFLGNLVEVITAIDDTDLTQLFSNQPKPALLKALFVFEAKLSLFTRFAGTGQKAILLLMNVNIVNKLCDMRVFDVRYFNEDSSSSALVLSQQGSILDETQHNIFQANGIPPRKTIMESIVSSSLKLFHIMVDNAPKNVLLVEQVGIVHFFSPFGPCLEFQWLIINDFCM